MYSSMKMSQELIDNGQKTVHFNYEKSDIKKLYEE